MPDHAPGGAPGAALSPGSTPAAAISLGGNCETAHWLRAYGRHGFPRGGGDAVLRWRDPPEAAALGERLHRTGEASGTPTLADLPPPGDAPGGAHRAARPHAPR